MNLGLMMSVYHCVHPSIQSVLTSPSMHRSQKHIFAKKGENETNFNTIQFFFAQKCNFLNSYLPSNVSRIFNWWLFFVIIIITVIITKCRSDRYFFHGLAWFGRSQFQFYWLQLNGFLRLVHFRLVLVNHHFCVCVSLSVRDSHILYLPSAVAVFQTTLIPWR